MEEPSHIVNYLSRYLDGELPPDTQARVREHLARCRPCRYLAARLRRVVRLLEELEQLSPPDELWERVRQLTVGRGASPGGEPKP